jgi:hypothetical protein
MVFGPNKLTGKTPPPSMSGGQTELLKSTEPHQVNPSDLPSLTRFTLDKKMNGFCFKAIATQDVV